MSVSALSGYLLLSLCLYYVCVFVMMCIYMSNIDIKCTILALTVVPWSAFKMVFE